MWRKFSPHVEMATRWPATSSTVNAIDQAYNPTVDLDMTTYGPVAGLLDSIAATPDFHGAPCVGAHRTFDAAAGHDKHAEILCLEICHRCPHLARCAQWVLTLKPAQVPRGVVGGRVTPVKPKWKPPGDKSPRAQPEMAGRPAPVGPGSTRRRIACGDAQEAAARAERTALRRAARIARRQAAAAS